MDRTRDVIIVSDGLRRLVTAVHLTFAIFIRIESAISSRCGAVFALMSVVLIASFCTAAQRPNVVLIMTDDQGIGDFGSAGNPVIETPHLDAMVSRSASLSTFYVSPVCSATRACLMTGRYNYRTRCIDTWLGRSMMDPEEVTIAEVLSEAGYATGIFGKWHLGDCYPMRAHDQGFQQALVHRGGGLAQPSEPPENERRYTNPLLFHNGRKVQTNGYCTDVYFDSALKFIEKSHRADRNFFVYLSTNAPHSPFHDVPEDLRKHYMARQDALASLIVGELEENRRTGEIDKLARTAAMITNIDTNVGRLLARLETLRVTDNTLVIFLVDNGPGSRRFVGGLRGKKAEVHEGGVRSPLWMHWPARLKAGTVCEELAAHIDLMPTILNACGVEPPPDLKMDGRNLWPLLTGECVDWERRTIVIQSHRGDQPTRFAHFMIRDQRWKLLHASGFHQEGFTGPPQFELYDLHNDPGETMNLVDDQPQIAERLSRRYDAWFDDVSSTRPDNYAPPRIHIGTPHENPTVLTRQDWRGGTWREKSVGYWELTVAESGEYDVECIFHPGTVGETVGLTIADTSHEIDVPPASKSCQFKGIRLVVGDARLQASLHSGEMRRGVHQVRVTRVGGQE